MPCSAVCRCSALLAFVDVLDDGLDHSRNGVIRRHNRGCDSEAASRAGRDWSYARNVDFAEQVDRLVGTDYFHEITDARPTRERDDIDLFFKQQNSFL